MLIENILLISPEEAPFVLLKNLSSTWSLTHVSNAIEGIAHLKNHTFDLIFCDLDLPDLCGLSVLRIAKELHPTTSFLIFVSPHSLETASSAMKLGALQYLVKPLTAQAVETAIDKIQEHRLLIEENALLRKEAAAPLGKTPLIAESAAMKNIVKDALQIAKSQASVFLIGESGTGKEVIANAIHQASPRKHSPFIKVNCAAIPETLLESEFFGHERGSFTGALQKRVGRFELADGGSLLLDEISEIPLELQPKLLRAIQEQEFERVGGSKPIRVDVRLISTSNRNMQEAVKDKLFREDLFFRLHVVPLHIPPLRERKEDIIPLCEYYLRKICEENGTSDKQLSIAAKEKLLEYFWPGNVRELANVMERTVVMHLGTTIDADDVKVEFSCPIRKMPSTELRTLSSLEQEHIFHTLQLLANNKTQAAKSLGISLKTLRNKLKLYQSL